MFKYKVHVIIVVENKSMCTHLNAIVIIRSIFSM